MPSSAGSPSPHFRAPLWLTAFALAALALALLLAWALSRPPRPQPPPEPARVMIVEPRFATPSRTAVEKPVVRPAARAPVIAAERPSRMWTLLQPWTFAVDAIALLGLVAVLVVRSFAQRGRGARR